MYIRNPIKIKSRIIIPSFVGKYIVKNFNYHPIHKCKDGYYFTKSSEFRLIVNKLPFIYKKLIRW